MTFNISIKEVLYLSIKNIIILFIITAVFDFLFLQLNKFNPKMFSIFHKIPQKWKGKWLIKWFVLIILLLIIAFIAVYFRLSDLTGYIIAGFTISLCDFAFKKPQ